MATWTTITSAEDVTEEMIEALAQIIIGWPDASWADRWDRLDGMELADGTRLDIGSDLLSPALRRLKTAARKRA